MIAVFSYYSEYVSDKPNIKKLDQNNEDQWKFINNMTDKMENIQKQLGILMGKQNK